MERAPKRYPDLDHNSLPKHLHVIVILRGNAAASVEVRQHLFYFEMFHYEKNITIKYLLFSFFSLGICKR